MLTTLLLASLLPQPREPQAPPALNRPNVLFVLADDLGIGDLGIYNPESKIPTPNMDALARSGLRFHDAHSPSAVCTPTRYATLTGRYAWRSRLKSGVLWGASRMLIEPGRTTIASRMQGAGYRTAVFGKWHLGLGAFNPNDPELPTDFAQAEGDGRFDAGPHSVGFDESLVIPASLDMAPYVWVRDGSLVEAPSAEVQGSQRRWSGGGGFWRAGGSAPSFSHERVQPDVTEAALEFLERQAEKPEQPFFAYVPLAAPHTPWMPLEAHRGSSEAGWYGDFVHQVDSDVGRLLEVLERTGLAATTIVIVSSDNGSHWRPQDVEQFEHRANLGWRGMKADAWEAGHRVPLLVRWPGVVEPGRESHALVGLVDLFATLCEALELPLASDEAEDSRSMLDLWRGEAQEARRELVAHSLSGWFVLRDGPWKLIDRPGSGGFSEPRRSAAVEGEPLGQLYHLGRDPGELENLWLEEPERAAAMSARLDELRAAGHSVAR